MGELSSKKLPHGLRVGFFHAHDIAADDSMREFRVGNFLMTTLARTAG